MPCLILTGHPCSGKSYVARLIRQRALALTLAQRERERQQQDEETTTNNKASSPTEKESGSSLPELMQSTTLLEIDTVMIIDEATVCVDTLLRQSGTGKSSSSSTSAACFASTTMEKETRASLKAAFDRALSQATCSNTLVLLDSLNYIKGYRYELHCLSKAHQQRHGVVWILQTDTCVKDEWISSHGADTLPLLEELRLRYEPPDERNRWDQPLYKVYNNRRITTASDTTTTTEQDVLAKSIYNMHGLKTSTTATTSTSNDNSSATPLLSTTTTAVKKPKKTAKSTFKRKFTPKTMPPTQSSSSSLLPVEETLSSLTLSHPTNVPTTTESVVPQSPTPASTRGNNVASSTIDRSKLSLQDQIDYLLLDFLNASKTNLNLQTGISTQVQVSKNADYLHTVDVVTQQVIRSIRSSNHPTKRNDDHTTDKIDNDSPQSIRSLTITIAGQAHQVTVTNLLLDGLSWSELQTLRTQYLQWVAVYPPNDSSSSSSSSLEMTIAKSFVDYIGAQQKTRRLL